MPNADGLVLDRDEVRSRRVHRWQVAGSRTPRACEETSWTFETETAALTLYIEGRWTYEVDLERCRTSAQVLDWIMQVASKQWSTDAIVASLVRAINDLLAPQATLCSFGIERGPLPIAAILGNQRLPWPW